MEWGRSNGQKTLWFGSVGIPCQDYQQAIEHCERIIDKLENRLYTLSGRDYWEVLSVIRRNERYIKEIKQAMKEGSNND